MTFADKIISFNQSLRFDVPLPDGIRIMNPYAENREALEASSLFYRKYYSDNHPRKLILGINPGRLGAGVTGVPFTDTKRLKEKCGIEINTFATHEPSSVFVYEVIDAYGGAALFYSDYFISAVCPLGFVKNSVNGREVNLNYYDDRELQDAATGFIISSIEHQLAFGIDTDCCFCLGNNKNYRYLLDLNRQRHYFSKIIPLEHPRFIMQYRSQKRDYFVGKYMGTLKPWTHL